MLYESIRDALISEEVEVKEKSEEYQAAEEKFTTLLEQLPADQQQTISDFLDAYSVEGMEPIMEMCFDKGFKFGTEMATKMYQIQEE